MEEMCVAILRNCARNKIWTNAKEYKKKQKKEVRKKKKIEWIKKEQKRTEIGRRKNEKTEKEVEEEGKDRRPPVTASESATSKKEKDSTGNNLGLKNSSTDALKVCFNLPNPGMRRLALLYRMNIMAISE